MDELNKLREGVRAANLLTLSSLILSLLKLIVGLLTNSLVLISDALHSGSDLLTALVSLIGLKIAQKKENKRFPYGYYKAENLSALIVAALIIIGAVGLMIDGFNRMKTPSSTRMPMLALLTALTAVITSYLVSKITIRTGEKIKSQSLIANGKERLLDVISASLVFLAILLSYFNIKYVEGATTIIISLFILKVGLETTKSSVLALMDYNPRETNSIINWLNNKGREEKVKFTKLKIREAGPFLLGEAEVEVNQEENIKKAYERIEEIRKEAMKKFDLTQLQVIIKPAEKRIVKVIIPTTNKEVSEHFARANEFEVFKVDLKKKQFKEEESIKNPFIKKPVRAGLSAAKFLITKGIDYVITKEIGEISLHTLADNNVSILKAESKEPEKVIEEFLKGKLKYLKRATRIKDK